MTNKLAVALCAAILGLGAAAPVAAVPIAYTIAGTAAGTIDGTPFGFTDFTIVLEGQTTSIMDVTDGRSNLATSATLSLSGPSQSGAISVPITLFDDQTNSRLSLTTPSASDPVIVLGNPEFASYGLDTDLGPATSPTPMFFGFENLPTIFGNVTITAMDADPSFTAALDPGSSVAEPGALYMFAFGVAMLALTALRPTSVATAQTP